MPPGVVMRAAMVTAGPRKPQIFLEDEDDDHDRDGDVERADGEQRIAHGHLLFRSRRRNR